MNKKVKIKVSGYIEMGEKDIETIQGYEDPHTGLVYSIHMGYVDASNLEFEVEE